MTPQFYGNQILDWKVTLKFILSTLNFEDEKTKPHVKNNTAENLMVALVFPLRLLSWMKLQPIQFAQTAGKGDRGWCSE